MIQISHNIREASQIKYVLCYNIIFFFFQNTSRAVEHKRKNQICSTNLDRFDQRLVPHKPWRWVWITPRHPQLLEYPSSVILQIRSMICEDKTKIWLLRAKTRFNFRSRNAEIEDLRRNPKARGLEAANSKQEKKTKIYAYTLSRVERGVYL